MGITKATLARTQQTSAKKKAAKKATKKPKKAKKPKKKKAKKKKKKKKAKKKKKVVKYPGGKRAKGQHKSKASKAAGKKIAAAQKKKGIGLFAVKTLSADLAAICGKNKMARTEVVKALWAYIKKNKLNKGRTITPDAKLKKVLPSNSLSMFKMPAMLNARAAHESYHRCLAESHDLPALSRLHPFRPVDVRLPHQHAVGFGGALRSGDRGF